jgi:pilus assembly protein CpaD
VKARLIVGLAFALVGLQACDSPGEWTASEAPRQMRVDFQRLTHTAAFPPGGSALTRGEQESLAAFLQAAEVTTDDPVYLEAAGENQVNASRISALARELSRQGYAVATLPSARDAVPANALLVVVERYVVTPPECPNWTKSASDDHDNGNASNFGCSNLTNLGLMVANPRDLVIGRPLGPAEATAASLAIQRYRTGQTSPLQSTTAGTTYNYNINPSAGSGQSAPAAGQ